MFKLKKTFIQIVTDMITQHIKICFQFFILMRHVLRSTNPEYFRFKKFDVFLEIENLERWLIGYNKMDIRHTCYNFTTRLAARKRPPAKHRSTKHHK